VRVLINTTFLASPRFGGSWTYTYNLLRALDAFSEEVEFIVLTNSHIAPFLEGLRMHVEVVIDNPNNRTTRVGWERFILPRLARKYSPTVFHSTGNTLPRVEGCPSVVTVHDFQYHFFPMNFSLLRRTYLRYAVLDSMKRATAVVCISEHTKKHAMELYGIPSAKLAVIREAGLWGGEKSMATSAQIVRDKFDLRGPFVLSAGSSLPHKNLERLIRAFGMIHDSIPHGLLIVGERFGYGRNIDQLIEDIACEDSSRIKATGFVSREDLLGLYSIADAFVFPSLFEGFGIPALEAMECGCPVVSSTATSLPEVIDTAGEFFDPMDVNDIARALWRVCSDAKLRDDLREFGYKRAKEFSWEKVGMETMRLYKAMENS